MTSYEDVERELLNDLEAHAETARKWQGMVEGDESGHAKGMAERSKKAFISFLLAEYIPRSGHRVPDNVSKAVPAGISEQVGTIGDILNTYVGPAKDSFAKRRSVWAEVNRDTGDNSPIRFYGPETRILNGLIGNNSNSELPVPYLPEKIVHLLYKSTDELKVFLLQRLEFASISLASEHGGIDASQHSVAATYATSEGKRSRGGSVDPATPEWSGNRQPKAPQESASPYDPYSPLSSQAEFVEIVLGTPVRSAAGRLSGSGDLAPSLPSSQRLPSVVPDTPAASPLAAPTSYATSGEERSRGGSVDPATPGWSGNRQPEGPHHNVSPYDPNSSSSSQAEFVEIVPGTPARSAVGRLSGSGTGSPRPDLAPSLPSSQRLPSVVQETPAASPMATPTSAQPLKRTKADDLSEDDEPPRQRQRLMEGRADSREGRGI